MHLHDTMRAGKPCPNGGGDGVLDGLEFHVELVNEEAVGIDAILARIGQEAGKNAGLSGPAIDADALSAIQAAVDASVNMRKKKRLLEMFFAQVNNGGDASGEAFMALVRQAYDDAVEEIIEELSLKDCAREFIRRCVGAGEVLEAGPGLDAVLPPARRFGGGGHGTARGKAIAGIRKIVDEFGRIDIG